MREGDALGFIREACCDRNGSLALCQGVHLQHSRYSYSVLRICLQEIGDLISLEFWNGSLKAEFSTTCHKRSRNAQSSRWCTPHYQTDSEDIESTQRITFQKHMPLSKDPQTNGHGSAVRHCKGGNSRESY